MKFDLDQYLLKKQRHLQMVIKHGLFVRQQWSEGYRYGGKLYLTHTWSKAESGDRYTPSQCDCGIPPWETCKHSIY